MGRTSTAEARLLEVAIDLVHSRSYEAVGVSELCARAGVHRGTFYHFFRSKRDLTLAGLDLLQERTRLAVFEPAFEQDLAPIDRVQRIFENAYEYFRPRGEQRMPGCPFGNLAAELSTQDEAVREKIAEIFDLHASYFERAISEAVAAGEVTEIDPATSAWAVLAYLQGLFLIAKATDEEDLIVRLAPLVRQLLRPPTPARGTDRGVRSARLQGS